MEASWSLIVQMNNRQASKFPRVALLYGPAKEQIDHILFSVLNILSISIQ